MIWTCELRRPTVLLNVFQGLLRARGPAHEVDEDAGVDLDGLSAPVGANADSSANAGSSMHGELSPEYSPGYSPSSSEYTPHSPMQSSSELPL